MNEFRQAEIESTTSGANPIAAVLAATLVLLGGAAIVGALTRSVGDSPAGVAIERATPVAQPVAKVEAKPIAPAPAPVIRDSAQRLSGTLQETDNGAEPNADRREPQEVPHNRFALSRITPEVSGPLPRLNPRRVSPVNASLDTELVEASGEPRLKPAAGIASTARHAEASGSLLVLGQKLLAPDETRTAFFFADETDAATAPIAAAHAADTPQTARVTLARGENFVDALRRAGVRAEDRNAAAYAFGKMYDLRRLRPGQELRLTTAAPAQTIFQMVAEGHQSDSYLLALEFKADAVNRIAMKRLGDGSYDGSNIVLKLTTRLASVSGDIHGSLYNSAKRIGAPDKVVADLAAIFAYDVDFQREVFGGDEFEAVFEARYDENGRLVEAGDILYGRMKWKSRQKEKGYYRFASVDGGAKADYFDWNGDSAKRLLMKTPIDGARLSSGFGMRRHPISGYTKQHKGVDFAASRGTPIKAAGDGVIERADRFAGYGNYVRIRHGQGYKTAYGHMSGFAKGMRPGKRVEQGDIIGYVGSTGASTGPHLHYEVLLKDKQVNPQNLKVATGVTLGGADLKKFKAARDGLDAARRASGGEARVATDAAAAKQL